MELETVLISIAASVSAILAFLLARRISERIEDRTIEMRMIEDRFHSVQGELKRTMQTMKEKEKEIELLKSELERREEKIAEIQERLKFAEKVSARDIDFVRSRMDELTGMMNALLRRISDLHDILSKERGERAKK